MVWLSLASLCAMSAYGQRGGFGHSAMGSPDGGSHAAGPPAGAPAHRGPGGARRAAPLPYFPLFPGDFDYGYAPGYDYAPSPNVTIVQPPPPPTYVVVPPPPIPHPEIREYKPAPEAAAEATAEPPSFAIALRDGSVHSAMAVTVQDGTLHYVDPDGRHERISLDSVDRETTTRLNRERKLELRLPPSSAR